MTNDPGTVLVVGGADAADETAARLADALGVEITTAAGVSAALDGLDERVVDCVVSECETGAVDGQPFERHRRLLGAVRKRDPGLPVVLSTEDSNARGVDSEATRDRTFERPETDDLLAERVDAAVERRRAKRRADRHREITAVIRDVNGTLVRAGDRTTVESAVPAELAGSLYDVAAFVSTSGGGRASVTAVAGADPSPEVGTPVEPGSIAVDELRIDAEPSVSPIADLAAGGRRAAVVPVASADERYGVIVLATDRTDAFDETERDVLGELGDTTAYAIEAVATRAELERQNERLEAFAGVVSHDLRNPLQVADLYLAAARREHDSEELERVAQAHDRILELVDDVLTLARDGEAVVDPEPFELADVAEAAVATVETPAARLEVESSETFRGDPGRVRRILENLVRNALEHGGGVDVGDADEATPVTGDGGTVEPAVTVRVGTFDDGFYVADDGPGIPAEERADVFETGYTTAESGTGYGLAIVAELVDAHGWDVAVTESENGGARFEIRTG